MEYLGKKEDATKYYDEIRTKDPGYADKLYDECNKIYHDNHKEIIESAGRVLRVDVNYADAWKKKGYSLLVLEKYNEALECFDRVLSINPNELES